MNSSPRSSPKKRIQGLAVMALLVMACAVTHAAALPPSSTVMIGTVPLPESSVAIGTWPTPEVPLPESPVAIGTWPTPEVPLPLPMRILRWILLF